MSAQPSARIRPERSWRNTRYIVSHERRFVYFVVPKVACTSVKAALWPLFGSIDDLGEEEGGVRWRSVHKAFGRSDSEIGKTRLLASLERRFSRYFKFGFVRNPYDRLVSCYFSKISPHAVNLAGPERFSAGMHFEEFARAVCAIPDEEADAHFRSQHVTLCEPIGRFLPDFLGRFEHMEADFRLIAPRLGVPPDLPFLYPAKRRDSPSYRQMYTPELAQMVGERYREDIEVFGYHF